MHLLKQLVFQLQNKILSIINNNILASLLSQLFFISTLSISAQTIPDPNSTIGFEIGSDFNLATYEESISYFEKLSSAR